MKLGYNVVIFFNRNIYSFRVLDKNFSSFLLYITTSQVFFFLIKTSNFPNLLFLDDVLNNDSVHQGYNGIIQAAIFGGKIMAFSTDLLKRESCFQEIQITKG